MKAAFLDRDGVINKDDGYTHRIDQFEFLPGVIEALKKLQSQGFLLIIVTNQSGIGRGYYSDQDYQLLTQWYLEQLSQQSIKITEVFYCPHTPEDNCECRKPRPGLFNQAIEKYNINVDDSLMVGDKVSDIQAAQSAGINSCYLVNERVNEEKVYSSLIGAVDSHLEQSGLEE